MGAVWATAAVAGPLLGGTLTDAASWRWIFLINLPLGALALVVVIRTMKIPHEPREHSIDYGGALALSVGVTARPARRRLGRDELRVGLARGAGRGAWSACSASPPSA